MRARGGVAELADAADLKSASSECGFESHRPYQLAFTEEPAAVGLEPMRGKRVKKTVLWTVFSVSGGALQRGAVVSRSETEGGTIRLWFRKGPAKREGFLNPSEARTHRAKHDPSAKPKQNRKAILAPDSHQTRNIL